MKRIFILLALLSLNEDPGCRGDEWARAEFLNLTPQTAAARADANYHSLPNVARRWDQLYDAPPIDWLGQSDRYGYDAEKNEVYPFGNVPEHSPSSELPLILVPPPLGNGPPLPPPLPPANLIPWTPPFPGAQLPPPINH